MEDSVKKYQSKNKNIFRSFLENIGMGHIFIFTFIGLVLIKITSNPEIDVRYNYIIYAALIGIIILISVKSSKNKILLDKEIVIKIAQEELNRMVHEGKEFAYDSKIYPSGKCNLIEDKNTSGEIIYTSWDIGFVEQVHGSQYKKDYIMSIHPYEGIILGVADMPLGYTGKEKRNKEQDIVLLITGTQKTPDISSGGTIH